MIVRHLSLLALCLALACGGRQAGHGTTARELTEVERQMNELRAAAAARPSDPQVWGLLAELELLGEAGNASGARTAIDHALRIAPSHGYRARMQLLSAWEHEVHGRFPGSVAAYLAAADEARLTAPGDPWAPLIAEIALDGARGARGSVPRFDATVVPVLERILAQPGSLGQAAVDAAALALLDARERAGDRDARDALASRLGCLTEWRAIGPFGPYTNLSFDQRLPPEGQRGPIEGSFDLRPGADDQAPFEGEARGCRVSFVHEEHAAPGSTIVETFVDVERGGPHLLRIDTDASFRLYVDGEETRVVDRRSELQPTYVFVPLNLTAGRHELELKLTSHGAAPNMTVALDRPGRLGEGYDPAHGAAIPQPASPAELIIAARALHGRGDGVHAAAMVGIGDGGPQASAAMLVHKIDLLDGDPFFPDDKRQGIQTLLYQRAHERDPQALYPAIREVLRQEDPNAVFQGFADMKERYPEVVELRYIHAELLSQRGRTTEAEAELRSIREDFPNECAPIVRLRALLADAQRVDEANALVDELVACNATSSARFELLLDQRRWAAAGEELGRLEPFLEEDALRNQRLRLAVQSGDEATEQTIREAILAEAPHSRAATTRRVDLALAARQHGRALQLLDEAAERDPNRMEGLRNLRRDLTGRDDMEAFRIDGAEVLRRYEEEGDPYPDSPQVLVLDYMVSRIYPDGSARHLVHQITRVQSEEAKDRLGQYSPRGRMLTLRTIKPDGRRLEPERIAGVDSIPLTDLAVGDYVEEEYIRTEGPRLNGGFLFGGWSFDSSIQPFHHSEILAVVPEGVELTVETTGGAPAGTEERRGGERVVRWLMQNVPIHEPEPDAVPRPYTRPSLRFGWRAGWEPHFRAEYDFLLSRSPSHPIASAVCRSIVEGAETREEAVGRVVTWVHDEIQPGGGWGEMAPAMLLAGQGHQTRLAHYLLRECDIPAQIALVRGVHEREPGELVDGSLFDTAVLVAPSEGGGEPLIVSVGNRDASWQWIPASLRGQPGVLLAEGLGRITVPDTGPTTDARRFRVDVAMGQGGAATVRVAEQHTGLAASVWRRTFRRAPEAELDRLMRENYVGRLFPGAQVTSFEIANPGARAEPLQMSFAAEVPRFGRPTGGGVLVPNVFAVNLAQALAQRASRETTLGVGGRALEVVTRIEGVAAPEETVGRLPSVALEGFGGSRYSREARVDGGAVVVTRKLVVPETNVPASDYEAFARFCRAVTEAEMVEIPVRPAR